MRGLRAVSTLPLPWPTGRDLTNRAVSTPWPVPCPVSRVGHPGRGGGDKGMFTGRSPAPALSPAPPDTGASWTSKQTGGIMPGSQTRKPRAGEVKGRPSGHTGRDAAGNPGIRPGRNVPRPAPAHPEQQTTEQGRREFLTLGLVTPQTRLDFNNTRSANICLRHQRSQGWPQPSAQVPADEMGPGEGAVGCRAGSGAGSGLLQRCPLFHGGAQGARAGPVAPPWCDSAADWPAPDARPTR